MWNYIHTKLLKIRQGFSLVEVIIAISLGSMLILVTHNSFSNILSTLNETSVRGTMDNYADSIRNQIRNELLSAQNIETRITRLKANRVNIAGTTGEKYDSIYYSSPQGLGCTIRATNTPVTGNTEVQNSKLEVLLVGAQNSARLIRTLFNSEASNGVYLENIYFDISQIDGYSENQDMVKDSTNLLSYEFTLVKYYPNGKLIKKTYHFKELIECSNKDY